MRVHGESEGLFLPEGVVRGPSPNQNRHTNKHPLAAPAVHSLLNPFRTLMHGFAYRHRHVLVGSFLGLSNSASRAIGGSRHYKRAGGQSPSMGRQYYFRQIVPAAAMLNQPSTVYHFPLLGTVIPANVRRSFTFRPKSRQVK